MRGQVLYYRPHPVYQLVIIVGPHKTVEGSKIKYDKNTFEEIKEKTDLNLVKKTKKKKGGDK